MENLQTRNIFIDTTFFRATNFGFKSKKYQSLVSLAQQRSISIKLTDITVKEIESNIRVSLFQAEEALKSFRNKAYILRNLQSGPFVDIFDQVDLEEYEVSLLDQFQEFLDNAQVQIIPTESVPPGKIFDLYFSRKPPFGSGKKKTEFPDAFVIEALKVWCAENNESLYICSDDNDIRGACQDNDRLFYIETLDIFTDRVIRTDKELTEFLELLKVNRCSLEREITEEFEYVFQFLVEEGVRIISKEVISLNLLKQSIEGLEPEFAIVIFDAEITFQIDLEYFDFDVHFNDDGEPSVEWEKIGNETSKKIIEIPIEVTIQFPEYHPTLLNVERIVINKGNPLPLDLAENC
jgi:hypothetical protein